MPRRISKPAKGLNGSALDAGLRLLGRRAHSRSELRLKLGRRGYQESDVDTALGRLIELGYLDDTSFASGHVRRRSAVLGPLALRSELAARGVERGIADEAVRGFDAEAQLTSAQRLAVRLAGGKTFVGYKQLLDSVGSKLVRRGFSLGVARAACSQVWEAREGTSDPLEL